MSRGMVDGLVPVDWCMGTQSQKLTPAHSDGDDGAVRSEFLRNRAIVNAILAGMPVSEAARADARPSMVLDMSRPGRHHHQRGRPDYRRHHRRKRTQGPRGQDRMT